MNNEIIHYVERNLPLDLKEVSESIRAIYLPELSIHEKALIYAYSERGSDILTNESSKYLNEALSKLPNYKGVCYRGIKLGSIDVNKYMKAFYSTKNICEPEFISTSKHKNIALQFSNEVVFYISSLSGKEIEKIAKFGLGHPQNEYEVLFKKFTKFYVEEYNLINDTYQIILKEMI